jgi:restriction system protein
MARRGFLAEVQRQIAASQREAERAQKAAAREHQAALRKAEQTRKAEERAVAKAARASEADRKRLEREAKTAHVASMQAEVEEKNAALADMYDEIDGLLAATLDVDDYVGLDDLRRTVEHPAFDRSDLETSIPSPPEIPAPAEPQFEQPVAPKGLFGKKKKLAEAETEAHAVHAEDMTAWQEEMDVLPALRQQAADEHAKEEAERVSALATERARYDKECIDRDAEVAEYNAGIDTLATNLGYGTVEAVEEYIMIVLSNSAYPEHFAAQHEFDFDPSTAELQLRTLIPGPDEVPTIKTYKYTKPIDEISTTALSQKASKDRYMLAVQHVALRTLHEIFEADRRGLVNAISLELGTETIDPATGNQKYVPFVAVAADRETFTGFDLSAVQPAATLDHLGAAVSKNPFGLVPANTTGIRSA